jgi:hypothetical protein
VLLGLSNIGLLAPLNAPANVVVLACAGEGVNHEVAVLHLLGGVAGARRILPPSHNDTVTAAGPGSASSSATGVTVGSSSDNPWLYEGGSLAEILERAADAAGADPSAAEQPQAQQRQPAAREKAGQQQQQEAAPAAPPAVLLFHGVCAWAEGQLEGETTLQLPCLPAIVL